MRQQIEAVLQSALMVHQANALTLKANIGR
jgi:hypothetical protein